MGGKGGGALYGIGQPQLKELSVSRSVVESRRFDPFLARRLR